MSGLSASSSALSEVSWNSTSQCSSIPASSTHILSWTSPHLPRTFGLFSASFRAPACLATSTAEATDCRSCSSIVPKALPRACSISRAASLTALMPSAMGFTKLLISSCLLPRSPSAAWCCKASTRLAVSRNASPLSLSAFAESSANSAPSAFLVSANCSRSFFKAASRSAIVDDIAARSFSASVSFCCFVATSSDNAATWSLISSTRAASA